MKTSNIIIPNFEDIVFENRNRAYGAYDIRKTYKKNVNTALLITSIAFLIVIGTLKASLRNNIAGNDLFSTTFEIDTTLKVEKPDFNPPDIPEAPKGVEENRFQAPLVVDSIAEVQLGINEEIVEKISDDPVDLKPLENGNLETTDGKFVNDPVFFVQEPPQYPGGEIELMKFIADKTIYPQAAREAGIEGKVFIRFCVTSKGTIDRISLARGVDILLDQEALRVVKLLPKWKPGKQNGMAVNVWYTVPINFKLIK